MTSHVKSPARLFASAVLSLCAAFSLDAAANSQDLTPFNTRYPAYYTTNGCGSCHTSAPAVNSYGLMYRTAVNALGGRTGSNPNTALGNIEASDADGDGYTNASELKNAGYLASDANSHPTASVTSTSASPNKSGAPNTTVSYTVTVTNNGNIPDSFTLSASVTAGQSTWTPSIVGTANNVASAGTASITVNVTIPVSATNAQTSTATFTAASQARSASTGSIALVTTATVAVTGPRYVSAATGVNAGDCRTAGSPCRTITYAVGQAANGDIVNVAPGVYNTALGEVFPIAMKSGLQLQSTGSAFDTVIDGAGGTAGLINWSGNAGSAALIRDLTFRNGLRTTSQGGSALGGAIYITGGTALITIQRCVFRGNESRGYSADNSSGMTGGLGWGGAIAVFSSNVQIMDSLFTGNAARGGNGYSHPGSARTGNENGGEGVGGAIYFAGTGFIANNTFVSNAGIGGNGGASSTGAGAGGRGVSGAIDAAGNPAPNIYNNIFHGNAVSSGTGSSQGVSSAGAMAAPNAATVTKNLFFANTVNGAASSGDTLGTASIAADPQFHNVSWNLRLGFPSPARGAGTVGPSAIDLDKRIRPNPPSIGAFEASGVDMPSTDLDGDGKSDILWRNSTTGQVYRMRMNGLAISDGAMAYTEPNTAWKVILEADFNADGISDLLWRNSTTGQVYLQIFNSAGLPGAGNIIYTEPNPAWKIIQAPDLDGDGNADLLWWNSSTGQVYGMILSGFSIIGQGMVYTEPNTQWQIAGVGDLSGSGRQNQLVWRNQATGQVYLMTVSFSGGAFSQSGQIIYNSILPYKIVGVADFDGDGRSDLLWRHDTSGDVYLMLMNGPAIVSESVIYTEPSANWKIVANGDYDGNGKSDILWRNIATGQVYLMLMNGAAIASQALIYTEPNTAWKVLGPYEFAQ